MSPGAAGNTFNGTIVAISHAVKRQDFPDGGFPENEFVEPIAKVIQA